MKYSAGRIVHKILLLILVVPIFPIQIFSQDFGGFRPNINWQQINTPAIRVIFPKGMESQANHVANNILYLNENNRLSIGPRTRKLDLILNNQGVISNGYVTLMPFRSEFYTTPMQDGFELGTVPWLDVLSIHEYRHALQYINMRQGFTKIAWLLTGEAGWGTLINLTTPGWFFEGDAVATETALTKKGRGRLPFFFQQYKSILLNDKMYSYMKARNGSFRDIVPDQYELGYLLCSYGREKYGNDLWPKVIKRTSWLNGIIYPFSDALMVTTGLSTRKFYKKALLDYKETWTDESDDTDHTRYTPVSIPTNTVTDYRFPVYQPNGNLLVYKSSYKEIGAIYRVTPDGSEEKICTTGISQDPYFSQSGNLITWSEVTWDIRYSSISYSNIVVYNIDTGNKTYLTSRKRYFSPSLSADGARILVAEVDPESNCHLKVLDSRTGEVVSDLPNDRHLFYTYPKWDVGGNEIISSARTESGNMLIIKQSVSTGSITDLTPEFNQVIGEVCPLPDAVLFTSGFSGINNVFSLSRQNGTIIQLTSAQFGAYYPAMSPDNKRLVYSDFNIKGYSLVSASTDSLIRKKVTPESIRSGEKFEFNYFATEGGNILDKIPDQKLEIKPYHVLQHPVRIHSWSIEPGFFSTGLSLMSDNTLSDIHLEGGISYDYNERAPGYNASVQYGGLFPILSAGISSYYRHGNFLDVIEGNETSRAQSLDRQLSFNARVPLNLSKGAFYRQIDMSLGYNYISSMDLYTEISSHDIFSSVSAIEGQAGFTIRKKKARQNITTPLGVSAEILVNQSVGATYASRMQAIGDFSVQGFAPNHNLVLSAGLKLEHDHNAYHFMDRFIYPRGFSIPRSDWMLTLQSTYHFPVVYPDFGFWGIFYCSRVRADLYADYGFAPVPAGVSTTANGVYASVGSELIFDTRWFNIADIPMGVRFSLFLTHDFDEPVRKTRVEFVLPIIRL